MQLKLVRIQKFVMDLNKLSLEKFEQKPDYCNEKVSLHYYIQITTKSIYFFSQKQ